MIHISKRDRIALIVGGASLFLFLVIQFGVFPLFDHRDRLKRGIAHREKALIEMRDLQRSYQKLHGKANALVQQLTDRSRDFSLFSFLEKMAALTGVKKRIAYMKPSETADEGPLKEQLVEMKLQAVGLQELVSFLRRIESPENVVALKRISIQKNKKEKGALDVIMQVISLKQNSTVKADRVKI